MSGIHLLQATVKIGKDEGLRGYWRGNLPQVPHDIVYIEFLEIIQFLLQCTSHYPLNNRSFGLSHTVLCSFLHMRRTRYTLAMKVHVLDM
jgi:hypothetical protein